MFSPKTRIAFSLTGIVVCLIVTAKLIGFVPRRAEAVIAGRGQLCESIAMSGSALLTQSSDIRSFEALLSGVVQRNPELLSAGLRTTKDRYIMQTEGHAGNWQLPDGESSNDQFMFVPLLGTNQTRGQLELCFAPIKSVSVGAVFDADAGGLLLFVGPSSFLVFSFVLGLMLKQLDPSGAIPKRVADALNSLAEGLLIVDTRDCILYANESFAGAFGVDQKKLIGQRSSRLGWLEDGQKVSDALPWQRALEEARPVSNLSLQLRNDDGDLRSFVVNASPIVAGQDGKFKGVLVTFDDVTTLEQQKVALGQAQEAAESANRAKSEFLANMSHEIRTPMNAILGFTDVLRRGLEQDEGKRARYLDTIHSSGSHLIELINDILDLSKIEAGKLNLELAPTSPFGIMTEVVDVLKVRAEQKGILLQCAVHQQIPETIQTDPTRVRQVLTNLVGNAIKFTETGGVLVNCHLPDPSAGVLAFDIADTGIGMTDDQAARIFNPFEQADSSVTRRFGGTGLGLSISKRFAEALGGDIQVKSKPGQGTVFKVRIETGSLDGISMHDEATARQKLDTKRNAQTDIRTAQIRKASILLVDDGESNREFLSIVLGELGMQVTEAENGQQAVDALDISDFDLVLMDMQMPVMDGYTATRTLRDRGVTIPIIALTANAMQDDQKKCEASGCDGFLAKPVDMDRLTELLRDRLGESHGLPGAVSLPEAAIERDVPPPDDDAVQHVPSEQQTEGSGLILSTLLVKDPAFRPIIAKFIDRLPERLEKMCDAWDHRDYVELKEQAHWLKGAGGTVGFGVFTEPAKRLEGLAQDKCESELENALSDLIDLAVRIRLDPDLPSAEETAMSAQHAGS